MKTLLLVLLFISCGKQKVEVSDSKHEASGSINIIIDWNLDQLQEVFISSCEAEFETQEEIDQCVADQVADLVNLINEGIKQANQEEV